MNEKYLKRRYEELLFWGKCLVLNEYKERFRTYLQIRGITYTDKPDGEYYTKFERGPLNK